MVWIRGYLQSKRKAVYPSQYPKPLPIFLLQSRALKLQVGLFKGVHSIYYNKTFIFIAVNLHPTGLAWTSWKMKVKITQSCLTVCNPMDNIVHGILQAQNTGVGSLSLLPGIFPTQGSNPGLPHCGEILYQLSHKGSPEPPGVTSNSWVDKAGLCGLLDPCLLSSELILACYMLTRQRQKGRTQPEEKRREAASLQISPSCSLWTRLPQSQLYWRFGAGDFFMAGSPVRCGMFSHISGLYSLVCNVTHPRPCHIVAGIWILVWHSVQFSHSVMSNSLRPHELQHTRPPCPSPAPGVHPNPCPSSRWCHPTISSSVVPFSSCRQPFPASASF